MPLILKDLKIAFEVLKKSDKWKWNLSTVCNLQLHWLASGTFATLPFLCGSVGSGIS